MPVGNDTRARVLEPIDRVSEIIFGLIMALSFTGTVSAATADRDDIRTVLFAALACNLAWGLVDAVMYLVSQMTERTRSLTLLRRIRATDDTPEAREIIADALPAPLGSVLPEHVLEDMRLRVAALPEPPARARLGRDDFAGALGVFLLVVLATFPVVIPFLLFSEVTLAMRVSNAIALVTLFACGHRLGSHAGGIPWRSGFAMAVIGSALVAATIALGG